MAVETMKQSKAKNLVFFHYDPGYDDEKLDSIKEYYLTNYKNVHFAYERLKFTI